MMLVLCRKVGERIVIGNGQVCVTVLAITKKHVRLGFVCPKDLSILRQEVLAIGRRERESSVNGARVATGIVAN